MNIFATYESPEKCARVLDDRRLVKMVLETAQLLSTAININGGLGPYKPTHVNHPCTKWTATSYRNYAWLTKHFIYLCEEYSRRYNKKHKCEDLVSTFIEYGNIQPLWAGTAHPNCTPFKETPTHDAYKMALIKKWFSPDRKTIPKYRKEILDFNSAKMLLEIDNTFIEKVLNSKI